MLNHISGWPIHDGPGFYLDIFVASEKNRLSNRKQLIEVYKIFNFDLAIFVSDLHDGNKKSLFAYYLLKSQKQVAKP
jgi:hypothetical protein